MFTPIAIFVVILVVVLVFMRRQDIFDAIGNRFWKD